MVNVIRWFLLRQFQVAPPRIKVGRVRLQVLGLLGAMGVENEFIRGEIHTAKAALDALRSGAVVSGGDEAAPAAPGALVRHVKSEIFRQLRGAVRAEERLAEPLGLPFGDHAAASGGDGHGPGAPQELQLDGGALHTGDAQSNPTVVDLVVTVVLQQGVGDLRQAESLLPVYDQTDDGHSVQRSLTHLVWFEGAGPGEALRVPLGAGGRAGVSSLVSKMSGHRLHPWKPVNHTESWSEREARLTACKSTILSL